MQHELELKEVSVSLYKYMCENVVGSENVVRYRRLYCKLNDEIFDDSSYAIISSGSKAEGLDLPGSDYDIMFLAKNWLVYETKPNDDDDVIVLDTDNALPGFALLKVADNTTFPCPITVTANGNYIANIDYLKFILGKENDILYTIHGPSLSNSALDDTDLVFCFKYHTWPTIAKNWLLRYRPSNWPSRDVIYNVVDHGVLVVPIGSKTPISNGNSLEWRFSFSLSEKLIVCSFNHSQLLCYSLLKIFLKQILNKDKILHNKLCSYYMKTVLFWIIEEVENFKLDSRKSFTLFSVMQPTPSLLDFEWLCSKLFHT
ncbi:uncharacterized protein [Mytilus edulis]|uniref:uncharacterized protein n=1 Tax=Mytilus edulis TaxID=6550 RepID=UPI0039EEBCD9